MNSAKRKSKKLSLEEIAVAVGGLLKGEPGKIISGPAPFETAVQDQITFAGAPEFLKKIKSTGAGAVIVPMDFEGEDHNLLKVQNPKVAFTKVVDLFYQPYGQKPGISRGAHIGENFECGQDISIGSTAVISDNVTLGNKVTIYPGTVIGAHVSIGDHVVIYPNVTILERCVIGNRVIIHSGTVIGSDGFGFAPDGDRYVKIPHKGIVRIDDDVELGAVNAVDRGTYGETRIKKGVKTDNLVHVAHNVCVGENTVLVAQVGIAGSTTIGNHGILAGQAGVSGHLTLGDNVTVGPKAGVAKSVPDGSIVSGSPEMPHKLWLKVNRIIPRLPELKKRIFMLEKKIKELEEKWMNGIT